MRSASDVAGHYTRGNLLSRLDEALREDGVDPDRPTLQALAPYDHFHGRGLEATEAMADRVEVAPEQHLLDIGSGIGGPARYFASRFGCRVTGIDLTPEFCEVARQLTRLVGLEDRVGFEVGDALAMPFAEASFDGAYSMNVSMNIADNGAFYREIRRVLKPGAWLLLSEVAQGAPGELHYPTPWAESARTNFLSTPEETRQGLLDAGFEVLRLEDNLAQTRTYGARSRAMVERGEKPPHRAIALIHGAAAPEISANMARNLSEGRVVPIEVLAVKRA